MKSKRRRKGSVGMIMGLLLLAGALFLTVYNLWDEQRAENSAARTLTALREAMTGDEGQESTETRENGAAGEQPDYVRYPDMEMPTIEIDGNRYIGELNIPVLELSLPILSEWSLPLLGIAPCRYTGSAYSGDLVIAGHNYRSHFGSLKYLSEGDAVIFTDVEAHVFRYVIAEIEVLDGTAVEEMQEGNWDLTLFTCTYGGQTRLTLRCVLAQ